jgi:hypothetical protein
LLAVLFQLTAIEFDFFLDNEEDQVSIADQHTITQNALGQVWQADDEEDLVEELTCAYGWCINHLDYRHVLS